MRAISSARLRISSLSMRFSCVLAMLRANTTGTHELAYASHKRGCILTGESNRQGSVVCGPTKVPSIGCCAYDEMELVCYSSDNVLDQTLCGALDRSRRQLEASYAFLLLQPAENRTSCEHKCPVLLAPQAGPLEGALFKSIFWSSLYQFQPLKHVWEGLMPYGSVPSWRLSQNSNHLQYLASMHMSWSRLADWCPTGRAISCCSFSISG